MSDVMVAVSGLGKAYRLNHAGQPYKTFREQIAGSVRKLVGRGGSKQADSEQFWALKDVSFEIMRGDVLGVIGRNGAGKSTLLKVLSRITAPTKGSAQLNGRIASLLEVGTGFHPELTGRENIFLNGAILGMRRKEVARKFEQIVSFAEVEKFIDTPVKRYSSGMYVRLAFAVAAHLEPEILIVDEVLAVGDAEFQRKCLGVMHDVARDSGRTILFVSHNISAVRRLCNKGLVLEHGQVRFMGEVNEAISEYVGTGGTALSASFVPRVSKPSITMIEIKSDALHRGELVVDISFSSPVPLIPVPGIVISSIAGTPVYGTNTRLHPLSSGEAHLREGTLRLSVKDLPLTSGTYSLSAWLGDPHMDHDERRDVIQFEFKEGESIPNRPSGEIIGYLNHPGSWALRCHEQTYA